MADKHGNPDANPDPLTGTPGAHPVGVGTGAIGGAAAGAEAEPELRRVWETTPAATTLSWERARSATRDAWNRVERGFPADIDWDGF